MSTLIVVLGLAIYIVSYYTYGRFLDRRVMCASAEAEVPSKRLYDGVDYVPANKFVLFGHHFASIAGAGPIVGPAMAMAWGWLPGILWVWFGNVFMGAVHDYLSLMASVRYDGKSVQFVARDVLGRRSGVAFSVFVLFLLILVVAAFAAIVGNTFVNSPESATAFVGILISALILGVLLYRTRIPFGISTVIGIVLLVLSVWVGSRLPIRLTYHQWQIVFLAYIVVAASLPVNVLLQPRDYLNSFLLYAGLVLGAAAALVSFRSFDLPAVTAFAPIISGGKATPFWPAIPLIIACGSISGFHSLVASGTTSKQLASEKDALFIGCGCMFTEGFLATLVIVSIAGFSVQAMGTDAGQGADYAEMVRGGAGAVAARFTATSGGAVRIFTASFAEMVHQGLSIPRQFMIILASMWLSSFAMTTLDTSNRLSRYIFAELMEPLKNASSSLYILLTNRWVASLVVAGVGIWLAWAKTYTVLWPAFSGANQLLASIAMLTGGAWLAKRVSPRFAKLVLAPGVLLWITVTAALLWFLGAIVPGFVAENPAQAWFVGIITVIMLVLNMALIIAFVLRMREKEAS